MLTKKQTQVLNDFKKYDPRIIIQDGGKRAGKTFINNMLYLGHVAKYENQRKEFIIGGATKGSVWRNVLLDFEKLLGREIKFNQDGGFELFGNKIFVFGGEKGNSWKAIRGMTSYGTYFNEGTALNKSFIEEGFSRTSGAGAKIFIDTNTDNPNHDIKVNLIDRSGQMLQNGQMNIYRMNWKLDDNDKLDPIYIESIKNSTPSGATYERDINGLWVSSDGVIYKDFSKETNLIKDIPDIQYYIFGIDWGFEHYGSCVVVGYGSDENYYIVDVVAEQHKYYEWWEEQITKLHKKYRPKNVWVDGARADYKNKLDDRLGNVYNAKKNVQEGINKIGSLFKQDKLLIKESLFKGRLENELYNYNWGLNDEPKKEFDDVLDSVRYAIYSETYGNNEYKIIQDIDDYLRFL